MTGLMTNFVAKLRGIEPEEAERKPNAPWDSYRYKPVSARQIRRRRIADILANSRKNERTSRRRQREVQRITDAEAVRLVRAWEAENGSALSHLLRAGDLTNEDVLDSKGIPIFVIADKLGLLNQEGTS